MASVCKGDTDFGEDPGSCNITFAPSVSEQRYQAAVKLTKEFKPRKVIDMGCGPCSMIHRLKWHHCIEELIGVDVDAGLLRSKARLGEPVIANYIHPRENPFTVRLYQGSISQVDDRLKGCNLFICIEVIEHLFEDDLGKVPSAVFGGLRPERALITTPNSDFNILFRNKTERFRHPDHKFEWSRQQFRDWCSSICDRYPYSVQYLGIGAGPKGTEEYGCCTQGAVFTLGETDMTKQDGPKEEEGSIPQGGGNHPYKLISEINHPFKKKQVVPLETRIQWQLEYCIRDILTSDLEDIKCHDDSGGRVYELPLETLLKNDHLRELCSGNEDLLRRSILAHHRYTLSEDQLCLLYREEEAASSGEESSSPSSDGRDFATEEQLEEEDWDVG